MDKMKVKKDLTTLSQELVDLDSEKDVVEYDLQHTKEVLTALTEKHAAIHRQRARTVSLIHELVCSELGISNKRVAVPTPNNELINAKDLAQAKRKREQQSLPSPRKLRKKGRKRTTNIKQAIKFIQRALADKPILAVELARRAKEEGISTATLNRARRAIRVHSAPISARGNFWVALSFEQHSAFKKRKLEVASPLTKQGRCQVFLKKLLRDAPVLSKDVHALALEQGFNRDTIKRCREIGWIKSRLREDGHWEMLGEWTINKEEVPKPIPRVNRSIGYAMSRRRPTRKVHKNGVERTEALFYSTQYRCVAKRLAVGEFVVVPPNTQNNPSRKQRRGVWLSSHEREVVKELCYERYYSPEALRERAKAKDTATPSWGKES